MKMKGSFGGWLKQRRKALDLTQAELADQVGCAVTTLQKIEADERRPSKQMTERLADALAVSPDARSNFIRFARLSAFNTPALFINLPSQSVPFFGREFELASIENRLADPNCRLLTLLGPGGIGKTRLALELANRLQSYAEGAYFVSLQSITSAEGMIAAIGSAANIQFYQGADPIQQVLEHFQNKHALLILDNLEHLLDDLTIISEMLAYAPQVDVVVTSRERLHLSTETVFNVQGLSCPENVISDQIADYDAVKLFLQEVRRVRPEFTESPDQLKSIAHICRLVDGMPLALVLAAGWVEMLTLPEIGAEIARSLDILESEMRDLPERQRSMRATFDYSWRRLSEVEQSAFKQLSVFRGSFTRESAEVIAGASLKTLAGLVNKSLVRVGTNGRYDIHELLRQYGEEHLQSVQDDYRQAHDRHCDYYAALMSQSYAQMPSSRLKQKLDVLEAEFENIQYGWSWAVQHLKRDALWQSLCGLFYFAYFYNHYLAGEMLYAQAVKFLESIPEDPERNALLTCMLARHSFFCACSNHPEANERSFKKGLALLRTLESPGSDPKTVLCFSVLGLCCISSRPLQSQELCREGEALCREYGYRFELLDALAILATINTYALGDVVEGKITSDEGLALAQEMGGSWWIGYLSWCRGGVASLEGDFDEAKHKLQAAYNVLNELGDRVNATEMILALGDIARKEGDYQQSRQYFLSALRYYRETELWGVVPLSLVGLAQLLATQGEIEQAVELCALVLQHAYESIPNEINRASELLSLLESRLDPQQFIRAVENGKQVNLNIVIEKLLYLFQDIKTDAGILLSSYLVQANHYLVYPLSERELEILQLISIGLSNPEIAERLFIGVSTVKKHINHIYSKLDVETREQALMYVQAFEYK